MIKSREQRTSLPWRSDEMALVNGFRCVYTEKGNGALVIHLPGGGHGTIDELIALGMNVLKPKRIRENQFV